MGSAFLLWAVAASAQAFFFGGKDQVPWTMQEGWLTRPEIARQGRGYAVKVELAEKGLLFSRENPPEITRTEGPGEGWTLHYHTALGELRDIYTPWPELGDKALKRRVVYINHSGETQDFTRLFLRLAPLRRDSLAAWSPRWFRMAEVESGHILALAWWSEQGDWMRFHSLGETMTIEVHPSWRLEPGEEAEVAGCGIWLSEKDGPEPFRREARRWFALQGFTSPLRYPDWLTRGYLYEVSAGGHVEAAFSDGGGFENLTGQIDYLADLGVSALWLNAVHAHKKAPSPFDGGWNHYGPLDMEKIDPILGGEKGLRRLTDRMAAAGLHHIGGVVPHGYLSHQAEALPEWWTRNRDGSLKRNWGGYGMDNGCPAWQEVLYRYGKTLSADFRAAGFRVDVADGQGFNWGSPRTNHAGFSSIGAGREVLDAMARAVWESRRAKAVLLPESPAHPEYFATEKAAVLGYGMDFLDTIRDHFRFPYDQSETMNRLLRGSLEEERGGLPPGALQVRTLNNHDTVVENGRVSVRFGAGLSRALFTVAVAVPGVPMLYQEEEKGNFAYLRRLAHLRRHLPALSTAEAVYLPVEFADPRVFAVWRPHENGGVLALVNLSGEALALSIPREKVFAFSSKAPLLEGLSRKRVTLGRGTTFPWELKAYEAAFFFSLESGGLPPLPPPLHTTEKPLVVSSTQSDRLVFHQKGWYLSQGQGNLTWKSPGDWKVVEQTEVRVRWVAPEGEMTMTREEEGWHFEGSWKAHAPAPRLQISGANHWRISARTALLDDQLVRRHQPFPESTGYHWQREDCWGYAVHGKPYADVAPTGRLWESFIEPLHPENPALAFTDANEAGFLLSQCEFDGENIVLTDDRGTSDTKQLGLCLLFKGWDEALSNEARNPGMGQIWAGLPFAVEDPGPFHLSFRLRAMETVPSDFLEASRKTARKPGVSFEAECPEIARFNNCVYAVEPGLLRWGNLAGVAGEYRIGLDLRQSEAGPDQRELRPAYTVLWQGRPLELEWEEEVSHAFDNSYFCRAWTPAVNLSEGPHTLEVRVSKGWGGVRERFVLQEGP